MNVVNLEMAHIHLLYLVVNSKNPHVFIIGPVAPKGILSKHKEEKRQGGDLPSIGHNFPFFYSRNSTTNPLWIVQTALNLILHHDDVIKWKHFPRYRPFVNGIHRSPVNSPNKGQWRGALMFSLIFASQTFEQTIETPVIWDNIAPIMTSLQW